MKKRMRKPTRSRRKYDKERVEKEARGDAGRPKEGQKEEATEQMEGGGRRVGWQAG